MGTTPIKDTVILSLKTDDSLTLSKYINLMIPNDYINDQKTFTALNISCCFGSIKCVKLLLSKGWDINLKEKQTGNSSLLLAIKYGHLDLVKELFTNSYNINSNSENSHGLNALDIGIIYQQYNIVLYLINEKGFTINKTKSQYKTIMNQNDIFIGKNFDKFYNDIINHSSIHKESSFLNDKSIIIEEVK